jgi:hypothetical protein
VKETTEATDPDDLSGIKFDPDLCAPNWRSLAEALVWASRVIVVDELLQPHARARSVAGFFRPSISIVSSFTPCTPPSTSSQILLLGDRVRPCVTGVGALSSQPICQPNAAK